MKRHFLFNFGRGELTVPPSSSDDASSRSSTDSDSSGSSRIMTCGFEDVDCPAEAEVKEGHHGPLYSFRHHSQLRMLMTLYKELQGPGDDAILQYHDATVYRSDLKPLKEDEWLNDNNITFLYEYLEHVYIKDHERKDAIVLLRPAMAYLLMNTDDATSLKNVLPPLDKTKFVFMPINDNPDVDQIEGGMHWSLSLVCIPARKVLYYDTMSDTNLKASKVATKKMAQLLGYELDFVSIPTPQQVTMSDCGVLVSELTALLVQRILQNNDIRLSVDDVTLVATAGRTFILTSILQLIQDKRFEPPNGN